MRKVFVIGIGAGDPDQLTLQAIKAMNRVDVFFVLDKGSAKSDMVRLREQMCATHVRGHAYRFVQAPDPERDRKPADYRRAVDDWHELRAELYARMIAEELDDEGCGAFLVWGDPSLYDSTLRILDMVRGIGRVEFECEVIPGITSVQALAARHRLVLNRVGEPIHITTGRRLAVTSAEDRRNVVVMLDSHCAFEGIADEETEIWWGANLGADDEELVAGRVSEVGEHIRAVRARLRERHGWVMDTYLLRQPADPGNGLRAASD